MYNFRTIGEYGLCIGGRVDSLLDLRRSNWFDLYNNLGLRSANYFFSGVLDRVIKIWVGYPISRTGIVWYLATAASIYLELLGLGCTLLGRFICCMRSRLPARDNASARSNILFISLRFLFTLVKWWRLKNGRVIVSGSAPAWSWLIYSFAFEVFFLIIWLAPADTDDENNWSTSPNVISNVISNLNMVFTIIAPVEFSLYFMREVFNSPTHSPAATIHPKLPWLLWKCFIRFHLSYRFHRINQTIMWLL
jgi:hypothetical protein